MKHYLAPNEQFPETQPGDTVILNLGMWDSPLIIENAKEVKVQPAMGKGWVELPRLVIASSCSDIDIEGLDRLVIWNHSDILANGAHLVEINADYCPIAHCYISGDIHMHESIVLNWDAELIGRPNGVLVRGKHCSVFECRLDVLRYGIQLQGENSTAVQNQISIITGDHIRLLANGTEAEKNVLTRSYNIDKREHNDFIQAWQHAAPTPQQGQLANIRIADNILINDSTHTKSSATCQGIGAFDGVLLNSAITGNTIITDHDMGITLTYATGCLVTDNILASPQHGAAPRIHIGTNKPLETGFDIDNAENTVRNNQAMGYHFAMGKVRESGNIEMGSEQAQSYAQFAMGRYA